MLGALLKGGIHANSIPIAHEFDSWVTKHAALLIADEKRIDAIAAFAGCVVWTAVGAAVLLAFVSVPTARAGALRIALLKQTRGLNDFETFLWHVSQRSGLAVMVTLKSQKVYIGHWLEFPRPGEARSWLKLEPLLSGYRNRKLRFKKTTDYTWVREELEINPGDSGVRVPSDFDVLLPVDQIESVHPFDAVLYAIKFVGGTANQDLSSSSTPVSEAVHSASEPAAGGDMETATVLYWTAVLLALGSAVIFYVFGAWAIVTFAVACLLRTGSIVTSREIAKA